MTMYLYLILLFMTFLGALAAIFLKRSTSRAGLFATLFSPDFILGGFLYLIAALLNIYVLKKMDYSVVLPLTSITYIWTLVLAYFQLHEKFSAKKVIGIALIIAGAYFTTL